MTSAPIISAPIAPAPIISAAELIAADECPCGHPASAHDVVAARYCEATIEHARVRGCICKVGLKG